MGGMDVEGVLGWPWGSGSRTNTALLHLKGVSQNLGKWSSWCILGHFLGDEGL